MRAHAELIARARSDGTTGLARMVSDGPLTLRPTGGRDRARAHLVAGTFGPLGGDQLTLDVLVEPGATLEIAGVAATLVLPSREPARSRMTLRITIADGGRLLLTMPPTIVAAGADHTVETLVSSGENATLVLREETIRGRTGELGGSALVRTRVDAAGVPVLRQDVTMGGPVGDPWHPRCLGSLLVLGVGKPTEPVTSARAAWMTLPRDAGQQLTALGDDPLDVAQLLDVQLPRYTEYP